MIAAYQAGEGSIRMLAKHLLVSPEMVWKLLKQQRLTGDLTLQKSGSKKERTLSQYENVVLRTNDSGLIQTKVLFKSFMGNLKPSLPERFY